MKIVISCATCSKPFEIFPSGVGIRVNCSRRCMGIARANSADNFWHRVNKGAPDECWEWRGKRDKNGYGQVGWKGRSTRAHRVALSLVDGGWDNPLGVLHECDNPPCCNPSHLWRGSNNDNMRDKMEKNRQSRKGARGERSGSAKLTSEQVREIRSSPLSGAALARQYGVARNYIFAIKNRLTWRHIT